MEGDDFESLQFQECGPDFDAINEQIEKNKNKLEDIQGPVQKNQVYLGKYKDDFYRCKMTQAKNENLYEVEFIDFGNKDFVKANNLKKCPQSISEIKPQAFHAKLDHIKIPPFSHHIGEDAYDFFENWAGESSLRMVETRVNKSGVLCELYLEEEKEDEKSINYLLVKNGLALLDDDGAKGNSDVWREAADAGIDKNPEVEEAFD